MFKEKYRAISKRLHGVLAVTWSNSFWTAVYQRCFLAYLGKTTTKSLPWLELEKKVVEHMNSLYHRRLAGFELGLTQYASSMDEVPLMFQENANKTMEFKGTTDVPIKSIYGDKRYVRNPSGFEMFKKNLMIK